MNFETIQGAAGLVVGIVGTVGIIPIVDKLKCWLHLEGGRAEILAAVVAAIVAILSLIVSGELTAESFQWGEVTTAFLIVWQTSTRIYKRLQGDEDELATAQK